MNARLTPTLGQTCQQLLDRFTAVLQPIAQFVHGYHQRWAVNARVIAAFHHTTFSLIQPGV